jgi:hypothetical protein
MVNYWPPCVPTQLFDCNLHPEEEKKPISDDNFDKDEEMKAHTPEEIQRLPIEEESS